MRIYGFHQVKIKVGTEGQDDPRRLKALRWILGRRMDIRLDANEAWPASELLERVEPLRRFHPTALEQPVPHEQVDSLADLRPRLGIPVMLDESLCGFPDAQAAVTRRTADLFNVRISKCGGLLASLRIIALARRSGLGVQLGCHPGETGAPVGRGPAPRQPRRRPAVRRRFLRPPHPRRQPDPPGPDVPLRRMGESPRRPGVGGRGRSRPARGHDRPDPGDPV